MKNKKCLLKRLLGALFALVMGVTCVFTLVACKHEHEYGEWQCVSEQGTPCDEREYKQECECGEFVTKKGSYDDHEAGADGKCTLCGQRLGTVGLVYELSESGDYYSVTDYKGADKNVVIPNTYCGLPVSAIGEKAFYCSEGSMGMLPGVGDEDESDAYTGLTSIELPQGLVSIGKRAFAGCEELTSIELPQSLVSIGDSAFTGCGFTSIEIPEGLTSMDDYAFGGCPLTSAAIRCEAVGFFAFTTNRSLQTVVIGKGVQMIDDGAFLECASLTNVYYEGTAAEWSEITVGLYNESLTSAAIYYYSEVQPQEEGSFWHYGENGEIAVW